MEPTSPTPPVKPAASAKPVMPPKKPMPVRKRVTWIPRWQDGFFGSFFAKPAAILAQFWENVNHFTRTNYELGCMHAEQGNVNDAIFRFKIVTWLEPNHYLAWYNLGCCYLTKGEAPRATFALRRALSLRPKSDEAKFMLFAIDAKALSREQMPANMPTNIVLNQFTQDAEIYERVQLEALGYQAHRLMGDAVRRLMDLNRYDYVVLDLGCGTGMAGAQLRGMAKTMIGVDLSPEMAALAAESRDANGNKLYDDVHVTDLRVFLSKVTEPAYDVILACNVFNYVGDLTEIFDRLALALKPRGIVAITTDLPDGSTGYQIVPGLARFGHSEEYLRQQAARVGFTEASMQRILAYTDFPMVQCVLRKP